MQDLNVITKLNSEAHERDIPNQQAKGLYVVAKYIGLSYVGYSTHKTEVEANAAACEIGNTVGQRSKVYNPVGRAASVDLTSLASATLPLGDDTLPSESNPV